MFIQCEFIDLIIPISNIEKVYPGGFEKFKSDNIVGFEGRYQHDEFLFRDGAMNQMDIQFLMEYWKKLGLKGIVKSGINQKWKDFCIIQSMFDGPTLPCDWINFDPETRTVSYKLQL